MMKYLKLDSMDNVDTIDPLLFHERDLKKGVVGREVWKSWREGSDPFFVFYIIDVIEIH